MKIYLDNCCYTDEIKTVGMKALRDVLGPVGMVRFMQQI